MTLSEVCTICGHNQFGPGPMGRTASTGRMPRCVACESLERHRIVHGLLRALPAGFMDWRWGIQFSPDASVVPTWFHHLELSHYGDGNSIDVQSIPRRDGSFDFISLNHVLESVPDDRKAFAELARVLSPNGFMQLTMGGCMSREATIETVEPQHEWQSVRVYGLDALQRLRAAELGLHALVVGDVDACTGVEEFVHFLFRDPGDVARVRSWISGWNPSAVFKD